jgi:hypothetical protein
MCSGNGAAAARLGYDRSPVRTEPPGLAMPAEPELAASFIASPHHVRARGNLPRCSYEWRNADSDTASIRPISVITVLARLPLREPAIAARRVAPAISQVRVHLAFQRALQHDLRQPRQQPAPRGRDRPPATDQARIRRRQNRPTTTNGSGGSTSVQPAGTLRSCPSSPKKNTRSSDQLRTTRSNSRPGPAGGTGASPAPTAGQAPDQVQSTGRSNAAAQSRYPGRTGRARRRVETNVVRPGSGRSTAGPVHSGKMGEARSARRPPAVFRMMARDVPFSKRIRSVVGRWSLQFNVGRRWSRVVENPPKPDPLLPVRFFGIVATWCEEDIIEATVHNAFTQGCERVLIVDNGSPDDTVKRAAAAGAEIARIYHTDYYDENRRIAEMNDVINAVSSAANADHVWWLLSDADEFVHGPAGRRLVDYLAGLDRRFRVAGARVFDHFPTNEPANAPDRHPLDYQPLCQELQMAWCSLRHWKHPLIRWDRSGPDLRVDNGFHRVRVSFRVDEPREGVFMHHFQYRNRTETSERLKRLCEAQEAGVIRSAMDDAGQRGGSPGRRRWLTLDYVYSQNWAYVERQTPKGSRPGVDPEPWTSLVSPADASVARWYPVKSAHKS